MHDEEIEILTETPRHARWAFVVAGAAIGPAVHFREWRRGKAQVLDAGATQIPVERTIGGQRHGVQAELSGAAHGRVGERCRERLRDPCRRPRRAKAGPSRFRPSVEDRGAESFHLLEVVSVDCLDDPALQVIPGHDGLRLGVGDHCQALEVGEPLPVVRGVRMIIPDEKSEALDALIARTAEIRAREHDQPTQRERDGFGGEVAHPVCHLSEREKAVIGSDAPPIADAATGQLSHPYPIALLRSAVQFPPQGGKDIALAFERKVVLFAEKRPQ